MGIRSRKKYEVEGRTDDRRANKRRSKSGKVAEEGRWKLEESGVGWEVGAKENGEEKSRRGWSRAEQSRTGWIEVERRRVEQSTAEESRAQQSKAEQSRAEQSRRG